MHVSKVGSENDTNTGTIGPPGNMLILPVVFVMHGVELVELLVVEVGSVDVVKGARMFTGTILAGLPTISPILHSTNTTRNLAINI